MYSLYPLYIHTQPFVISAGSSEANAGMSPFGGHGHPPQSPSWPDSAMGLDRPKTTTKRYTFHTGPNADPLNVCQLSLSRDRLDVLKWG